MPEDSKLYQFEVFFKGPHDFDYVSGWSMLFKAESFAHAEEQALNAQPDEEIIKIHKDYEVK